jgi:5-methylcytosine-specific restriction endonuclease McrA
MSDIPAGLRAEVARRADNRCEYCGLSQIGQEAAFHVDHVRPRADGGATALNNLALACVSCSLRKAARLTCYDPETGHEVSLFNPRTQNWNDNFRWENGQIVPLTPQARATASVLAMNRPMIVAIRREEEVRGRQPPR